MSQNHITHDDAEPAEDNEFRAQHAADDPTGRTDPFYPPGTFRGVPYTVHSASDTTSIEADDQKPDNSENSNRGDSEPFRIRTDHTVPEFYNPRDYAQRRRSGQQPGAIFGFADGTSMRSHIPEHGRDTDVGRRAEAWNVDRVIASLAEDMIQKVPRYGPASIARVQRLAIALIESCLDEDMWGNCPPSDQLVRELSVAVQAVGNILFVMDEEEQEQGDDEQR